MLKVLLPKAYNGGATGGIPVIVGYALITTPF